MADRYGINMAQALSDAESIKGSRTRNEMAGMELDTARRLEAERPERERQQRERQNMLAGLRTKGAGGDVAAQQQLLAMDPEGAPQFLDAVSKMEAKELENTKRNVENMGKGASYVLSAKNPQEAQRRYSMWRDSVPEEQKNRMPEQFDPQLTELALSKAMTMDQVLQNPKSITVGGQDVVYQGGREIERQNKPVKPGAGGSGAGAGGLKAGDESLIYKQSAELLGGVFDDKGNIINLDPETRNKVQAIATRASNLFASRDNITRAESVKIAAQESGLNIEALGPKPVTPPGGNVDPNDIRKFLTQ